ncbi:MAG: hypothetical protein B5M55_05475 [Desulfococcus sp. 4484_242]|nr:MAG: hypothetical protein B5M55_05475 [Desulfococcus sp. 4484_242]
MRVNSGLFFTPCAETDPFSCPTPVSRQRETMKKAARQPMSCFLMGLNISSAVGLQARTLKPRRSNRSRGLEISLIH